MLLYYTVSDDIKSGQWVLPVFFGQVYICASLLEGICPQYSVPGMTKTSNTLTKVL